MPDSLLEQRATPDVAGADTLDAVRVVLTETLLLGERGRALRPQSGLLGHLPELDSMAVISLVTALENRFDIVIEDEDIRAQTFDTLAGLSGFVESKRAQ